MSVCVHVSVSVYSAHAPTWLASASLVGFLTDVGGSVDGKGGGALRENEGRFFWLRDGGAGASTTSEAVLALSTRCDCSESLAVLPLGSPGPSVSQTMGRGAARLGGDNCAYKGVAVRINRSLGLLTTIRTRAD